MQKHNFLLVLFLSSAFTLLGQNKWRVLAELPNSSRESRAIEYIPTKYASLSLDYDAFAKELVHITNAGTRYNATIQMPLPNGNMVNLITESSPVMEELLAAKYPSIQSFKAWSADKNYIARFDISPFGLRASIHTPEGEVYIDPLFKDNQTYYLSYYVKDNTEPRELVPACGVDHTENRPAQYKNDDSRNDVINLHIYRLALACTGEWGKQRGTVELALADMNTSVNRLNQIFESQFASRVVLINENDKLIQLDPASDPYTKATEGRTCMGQNTQVVNDILGNSNKYDLGHVYTNNCTDVGGVAMLGSICQSNKGAGCSCYYGPLITITVQVTSHEIGHQLSANHTFNNCTSDSQNAGDNGFEPGGGSTIMGYGGLCQGNNFVNANDDYYHNGSLVEIYSHIRSTDGAAYGCATKVPTTNNLPTVNIDVTQGKIIPIGTPFVLDGSGTDLDGDKLYFNWEQKDGGTTLCPLGNPTGTCPLFRSILPDTVGYRIFPRPLRLLAGQNSDDEVLPEYSREINFSLTARDKNPQGGMATWKTLKIVADASAGPFKVTAPNQGEQYEAGQVIDVTWDVANTDKAPINCKYVDIYLSRKSALHVSDKNLTLLAGRVLNIGKAQVQLYGNLGNDARILVKGSDNIFFDISNFRFSIAKSSKPRAFVSVDKYFDKLCLPNASIVKISSESIEGYDGNLNFEVSNLPAGITATFTKNTVKVGESNELKFEASNGVSTGSYRITYSIVTDGNDSIEKVIELEVTSTDFTSLASLTPQNGEKNAELPTFNWNKSINATSYKLEVSKDPTFSNVEFSNTVLDSTYRHFKTFDKKSIFYWRVKAINNCAEGPWTDVKSFGTLTQDCKIYAATGLPSSISGSGTPTIESRINVPTGTNISDVNVTKLKINHVNFIDLTGTLVAPSGKRVILWDKICEKALNIEVLVDDQAPNNFSCSNTASGQYRPKEKLEGFNGLDATGAWVLEIKDGKSGNGGKLDGFELEICASVSVENPVLVKDNLLTILSKDVGTITSSLLLAEDKNNTATELTFTIVKTPVQGVVRLNGNALAIGSTFTQDDINNNRITYVYTGNAALPTNDGFNYLVKDTEGGWFGVNTFNIQINTLVGTQDLLDETLISVFPNPSAGSFNIDLKEGSVNFNKMKIYTAMGQLISQQQVLSKSSVIDISQQANGVYIVEFSNGLQRIVKKLILAK